MTDIEEIATLSCSNCGSLLVGDTNIIIEYPLCDLCIDPLYEQTRAKNRELYEHQKFDDERLKQLDS